MNDIIAIFSDLNVFSYKRELLFRYLSTLNEDISYLVVTNKKYGRISKHYQGSKSIVSLGYVSEIDKKYIKHHIDEIAYFISCYNVEKIFYVDNELDFLEVAGGNYSSPINSIYCEEGKAPIVDSTGNCRIIAKTDIPTSAVKDENNCFYGGNDAIAKHNEATVTTNNVTTAYPTLEEAVEAAEAGSTINLMKDVEIKDVVK